MLLTGKLDAADNALRRGVALRLEASAKSGLQTLEIFTQVSPRLSAQTRAQGRLQIGAGR
jgi:hypothetical protein